LEDGTLTPTPEELGGFLMHLRGGALAPLLRASELTERRELQPVIRGAVQGIAAANPRALSHLLAYRDPVVQAGAARLVGRMRVTEASGAVANLLTHDEPEVRLAAVEASRELRASTSAGALMHRLDDPEREVRIAAARALGALRYLPAAERFKDFLDSKELRTADLSEKLAFFEGYAELGDPAAEGVLGKILNGRSFFGRRESPEMRACAALGLGRLGTPAAIESLRKGMNDEDLVVRSAVGRALRGGGEEA
jgi:HEAT repeat protein